MDGVNYMAYLRYMAPDITGDDILRLHDFSPRLTRMAASVRIALRRING